MRSPDAVPTPEVEPDATPDASAPDASAPDASAPDAAAPDAASCLAAAGLGLWECDPVAGALRLDPVLLGLHGWRPGDRPTLDHWLALLDADDRPALARALHGGPGCAEPFIRRLRIARYGDGATRWIELRGRRLTAPDRLVGIALDVTGRHAEEERTALLMREVDHRARNTLATVQALLRLTRADTPAAYAHALQGRIASLGRAQALLTRTDTTDTLRELLAAELAPYAGEPTRFRLNGPPLRLHAEAVQPLTMAVHELATNAAKHGALSRPDGQVRVAVRVEPAGAQLDWTETGGPTLSGAPVRDGFGSALLRNLIVGQLGGGLTVEWPATGLRCAITLPRRALASTDGAE